MSDQELLELKSWGHQLLNVLAEKRKMTKDEVYALLSQTRGIKKSKTHFATMGEKETIMMVNTLLKLLKQKSPSKKSQKKKEYQEMKAANKKVNQEEIRKAIARLPKIKVPWYRKLYRLIRHH